MNHTLPTADVALANCWNQIGVRGDQSCERLVQHIHCRNCEVFADAAQRNLQRPVHASHGAYWAAHFGQPEEKRSALDSANLVFRIGREWLSVPARMIASVAPSAPAHRLPHRSGGALNGIVNVAGNLLPCVSLGGLLGIDERDEAAISGRHTFARLVILRAEGQDFALPVAELHSIVRYAAASLKAPPATIGKGLLPYLTGVLTEGAMHIGVLDPSLLGHQMTRLLR